MVQQSYYNDPLKTVGSFTLHKRTPTLLWYKDGNTNVVAIRGTDTKDYEDIKADFRIIASQLVKSNRFKKDLATLQSWKTPGEWYGVGHSLGGAILDEFLRMGLLQSGVSYNAAVQPKDFGQKSDNNRIYNEGDPLYQVMGRFTNPEVRKNPLTGRPAHSISTFVGGTHRTNFLKVNKLEDKGYSLKELSKISKVPTSILQQVYDRGIGAYKTNPSSVRLKGSFVKNVSAPMSKKLSKEQWAMARVYSFLDGNPKHDDDLRQT